MYLLEHDAKALIAQSGVPVPPGRLMESGDTVPADLPDGPWVIKAQVSAGGRGKAGLIRKAAQRGEIAALAQGMWGATLKGRAVRSVRIEQQVGQASEAYVALFLDAAAGAVRIIMAAEGGVDIESLPPEKIQSRVVHAELGALRSAVRELAANWDGPRADALREAGEQLAAIFLEREAMLVEINPLFVRPDGSWVAGDAKLVTDDNALERQPVIKALLERRRSAYPEANVKLEHGFDYVVVDPQGEIGLLTTGAGLSMMLIDELRQQGLKPYNFLDVRTGGMRGDPARLVSVLQWLTEGRQIKVLLINIFAGITDLGEFSRLLVTALERVPELRVPVVARLVGNGLPEGRPVLEAAGIRLHTDLDGAVKEVRAALAGARSAS
jgi:succinyl-CoA synthetase beta subunit